jgi:hypothetical protein
MTEEQIEKIQPYSIGCQGGIDDVEWLKKVIEEVKIQPDDEDFYTAMYPSIRSEEVLEFVKEYFKPLFDRNINA